MKKHIRLALLGGVGIVAAVVWLFIPPARQAKAACNAPVSGIPYNLVLDSPQFITDNVSGSAPPEPDTCVSIFQPLLFTATALPVPLFPGYASLSCNFSIYDGLGGVQTGTRNYGSPFTTSPALMWTSMTGIRRITVAVSDEEPDSAHTCGETRTFDVLLYAPDVVPYTETPTYNNGYPVGHPDEENPGISLTIADPTLSLPDRTLSRLDLLSTESMPPSFSDTFHLAIEKTIPDGKGRARIWAIYPPTSSSPGPILVCDMDSYVNLPAKGDGSNRLQTDPANCGCTPTYYVEGTDPSLTPADITLTFRQWLSPPASQDKVTYTITVKVELHPRSRDFRQGKENRIMISALHQTPYHTIRTVAKDGGVSQITDAKVRVSAHLTPANALVGRRVYFRVVEPDLDDNSSYEPNSLGGDNTDTTVGPGVLSASFDTAVLVTGLYEGTFAVAEVDLNFTKQFSGDNYAVMCSLDPTFNSTLVTDSTDTLVAWKRMYLERDLMYKKGDYLIANASPGDSIVQTPNADIFSHGEQIVIFDRDHPDGEPVTIINYPGPDGWIEFYPALINAYTFGDNVTLGGRGAAIGAPEEGFYEADMDRLPETFGATTDGTDGGCFVEFVDLGNGGNHTPFRAEMFDALTEARYSDMWFANKGKRNVIHLVSAADFNSAFYPSTVGGSLSSRNWSFVYVEALTRLGVTPLDRGAAGVVCHELMHQFEIHAGQNTNHHVDDLVDHPNHANSGNCLMSCNCSPTDPVEGCRNGVVLPGDGDCIDDVRNAPDNL